MLARAVKRAALDAVVRDDSVVEPAPTFHNLRHSHGSALIAAGWDIEEVSARLGHANVGTTKRAYVHAYEAARHSLQRRSSLTALTPMTIAVTARTRSNSPVACGTGSGTVGALVAFGVAPHLRNAGRAEDPHKERTADRGEQQRDQPSATCPLAPR